MESKIRVFKSLQSFNLTLVYLSVLIDRTCQLIFISDVNADELLGDNIQFTVIHLRFEVMVFRYITISKLHKASSVYPNIFKTNFNKFV